MINLLYQTWIGNAPISNSVPPHKRKINPNGYGNVKSYYLEKMLEVVGIEQKDGVPRVIIFDKNRKAINLGTNDIWRTARDSSPQDIFNYFQSFKQDINN